jgi:DNA mismatch endonuclease (patch repair protein)
MMAGIKGRNTRPELTIRRGLHARGFRFRLHAPDVPGKPDLVLPRWRAAIFVNGCFWHGHHCHLFKMPSSRVEFWSTKIESNRVRDARVARDIRDAGWRSLTIWECALKGKTRLDSDELIERVTQWLRSNGDEAEIAGHA